MLNFSKTKFILFNPTHNYDFQPGFTLDGQEIEAVDKMKILGLTVTNDLKWKSNTDEMTKKAYKKLWIIRRLKNQGASLDDLTDIYCKQVRSILEFGVPVWNSSITRDEVVEIERVQKAFLHIALGKDYHSYREALEKVELETLANRRLKLCEKFTVKSSKHPNHKNWFKLNEKEGVDTRSIKTKYKTPLCNLERYKNSPIPYLTNLLNNK